MNKKDNSLFIAYLCFLGLCLIYRIVCSFDPSLKFDLWDRIIIGVTISSYFFTLSSGTSMYGYYNMYYHQHLDESANRIIKVSEKYINKYLNDEELSADDKELLEALKGIKQHETEILLKKNKEDRSLFLDVVGFLVFLLCLTFQSISDAFKSNQDIYTLCAFFLMLVTMYCKERYEKRIEKRQKKTNQ